VLQSSESGIRGRTSVSSVDDTAALRVHGEGPTAAKAVQLVQEYGLVLTGLVRGRLAPLGLVPFDPAHARGGRVSPHWSRNLVAGAVLGAVAGLGAGVLGSPARERPPVPPRPAPVVEPGPPRRRPEPEPEPEPEAEPQPEPEPEPPVPAAWSLDELRRRVDAAREAHPERVPEWDTYLGLLAQQEVGGVLPRSFDVIIDDVFGSLLY
jgi:hypothetical protein